MKYEKINDTHFVHMDDTKAVLKLAIQTGKNLILYGPGGYGKSDLVKFTLDALKIKYNYVVGDKTMPPEKLLGTVDFTKLTEESEFRVAFEKSPFLGAEVLVLEEFLDVAPDTAAALKDVISSGGHKYKDIFIPSDVKLVIITSNKAPDELATNDSLKAFYNERFLLHHRVDWEVKSAKMYS
ncbi:MAG: AAA family ATPase, partial [Chlamydiia bacterium]|nr:AAA family ATPase [Chlamydiia bacterium]